MPSPELPSIGVISLEILLLVVLVGLSAFFSLSEIALIALPRPRRRQLLEENHPRIHVVEELLSKPPRFLVTILVANTLVNVAATSVATVLFLGALGEVGVAVAAASMTVLLLVFGEIAPKSFASRHSERVALFVAPYVRFVQRILWPIVRTLEGATDIVLRASGTDPSEKVRYFRSEEEFKALVALGAEEGILEEEEEEMIHSVIELGERTARDAMVPRTDVVGVEADSTLGEVRGPVLESGYSRIPVYRGSLDNVVGILYVRDLLERILDPQGALIPIREVMREAYFVPETKKLDDLLAEMREKRVHMAIVVDEFGGTAGIVTLEDILEEIVGEIFDESDVRKDPIELLDSRVARVEGSARIEEINRALDLEIPEDPSYDTVAGYVSHVLGRLPREGEVVHSDTFDVVVEKVSRRRVLKVRIVKR